MDLGESEMLLIATSKGRDAASSSSRLTEVDREECNGKLQRDQQGPLLVSIGLSG